jgi:hypothetical protein
MNELPDIGSLWMDDKHGLIAITGCTQLATTGFNEILYTFHVLRVSDSFHTNGIFSISDWYGTFTCVSP